MDVPRFSIAFFSSGRSLTFKASTMAFEISSWISKMSVEIAVEAVGPQVLAGGAVDQLRIDPDAVAGLANAAFEDVADAQLLRHLVHLGVLALEAEGGVAGDDL